MRWILAATLMLLTACATGKAARAPAPPATAEAPPQAPAPAEATEATPEAEAPPAEVADAAPKPGSTSKAEAPPPAVPAPPPLPEVPDLAPDAHLAQGVNALKDKDVPLATAHLRACVAKDDAHVRCHWELGWARYLASDWAEVVAQWEKVKALDPAHPEVDARLTEARAQLELRQKLAALAEQAPKAVRPPPPEGASVRLRAVGDVMLGTAFPEGNLPPEDGARMLSAVRDWLLDADLTFVNLEGPLCDTEEPSDKCGRSRNCYAFRTPTHYVKYLVEAGVDLASTANNHSGDFGEVCRRQTEAALDAAGIRWSGPPGSIATAEANGLTLGLVAFHTSPATNNVNDLATAQALVKAAAAKHDLVVVSFHGGAEGAKAMHVPRGRETFFGENRGDLRRFTHAVVDAGADLVLGHGPHVLRGMELYQDRLIAYSLGNFATYGRFNLAGPLGVGTVLEVVLDAQGRFLSGTLLPTRQEGEGVPVKDEEGLALQYVRMLSQEDFPGTGVVVDAAGGLQRASEPDLKAGTGKP